MVFADKMPIHQFDYKKAENKISFQLDELEFQHKDSYQKISANSGGTTTIPGMPELPVFSTLYQINPEKTYSVSFEVIQSHVITDIDILPFQTLDPEADDNEILVKNNSFYNSDDLFPSENVLISDPQIMRDLHLLNVSIIPFQYDPSAKTLEIYDELEVEIIETGTSDFSETNVMPRSLEFEKLYQNLVVNFTTRDAEVQDPAILYICGGSAESNNSFQQLVNWREKRGYTVYTASTSETGTSTTNIKNYILNAYQNYSPPPEFVALVGDVGGSYNITTYYDGHGHNSYGNDCEGDHPFSQLQGNDLLPEVLIGRMSVRSSSELSTVVSKIIGYEKAAVLSSSPNYYERASCAGDPSTSGNSCAVTNEYVAELLVNYGMSEVELKTSGSSWSSWMENNLEEGVLYFNYRGYLGVSGFDNSDVDGANNGFKLPFATVLTCGTGSFAEDQTTLSEKFFRAGSATNPKGGVAAIGTATWNTHTLFNNIVDMGIYHGIFVSELSTAGGALASGKLALYNAYPGDPDEWVSAFTQWNNLIGDPATHLWTDTPTVISASFEPEISFGTNFTEISVTSGFNTPVENARVTLRKGNEIFSNSFTNANGTVVIPLDYTTSGDIDLTVTKHNCKPVEETITITSNDGISLHFDSNSPVNVNDNSGGNGDGVINPGESVLISIPVKNFGTQNAFDVIAILSSSSNNVSIIGSSEVYGTINSGATANAEFSVTINAASLDMESLELRLDVSSEGGDFGSWQSSIPVYVTGSKVNYRHYSVTGGNLSPGQSAELSITLDNIGAISSGDLTATLSTDHNQITINDNYGTWSSISSGQNGVSQDNYSVLCDGDIINGSMIPMNLHLQSSTGYDQTIVFNLQIGNVSSTDPLGPDEYGYYIYGSEDISYQWAPQYDWIEINPSQGGNGQSLGFNDSGDGNYYSSIASQTLPFDFQFYGVSYNRITVCSNGWIAFGTTGMESFRNYEVPGPGGPPAMVAAFWDDLKTSNGGNVYTYADPGNDYFIVEWSGMRTYDNNHVEDFQIIIYNNPVMPFGDGEIKIQYKTFNNTTNGNFNSYPPIHGNYATIGIENHLGSQGLQYSFNNSYPEAAGYLDDERAIFITTQLSQTLPMPNLVVPQADFDVTLGMDMTINDSFSFYNEGEEESVLHYSLEKSGFQNPGGFQDDFGMNWSDSNLEPTVDYNWVDISGSGTIIDFPHNDQAGDAIDIGFEFPFYGEVYTQCIVNANGWVGFGNDNTEWSNTNIPSSSAPNPAVLAYWDDLNPISGGGGCSGEAQGTAYYSSNADQLVVTFDDVAYCSGANEGSYTFQVVLKPSGTVYVNYQNMQGQADTGTIGLQNDGGTIGQQVVFNSSYAQDNLSLIFRKEPDWMEINSPMSGEVENGDSQFIDYSINTSGLVPDDYSAFINLNSNVGGSELLTFTLTVEEFQGILGDVNNDGNINVSDVVMAVTFILDQNEPDGYQVWAADLNADGQVNVVDIVLMVDIILGG